MNNEHILNLEGKQRSCIDLLDESRQELKRLEREYERIRSFKNLVERSQEDFCKINAQKMAALTSLEGPIQNRTAHEYAVKANRELAATGGAISSKLYVAFLNYLTMMLKHQGQAIERCEGEIDACRSRLNELSSQLWSLRHQET